MMNDLKSALLVALLLVAAGARSANADDGNGRDPGGAGLLASPAARLWFGPRPQPPQESQDRERVRFTHPDARRRQIVPFLEGTRVLHHLRFDSDIDRVEPGDRRPQLRFEADIQPNLVVGQNFSDRLQIDTTLMEGKRRWAYSIVGTPRVRLRMFNTRSAPVRTPSYMPKGTVSLMSVKGERDGSAGLWAGMLTVGHHSNGQDGCLFETDRLQDGECVGSPDLRRINLKDGSFSTNYLRVGARYRRISLQAEFEDAAGETRVVARGGDAAASAREQTMANKALPLAEVQAGYREWTVGVDVDLHFATDERVKPYYGTTRVEALVGGAVKFRRVCRSRAAAQVSVRYIGEPPLNGDSWVYQADATCTFNDGGGWGLFARFYRGQDYYNLGFAQSISRLQFGFHHENDGFLRFLRTPGR